MLGVTSKKLLQVLRIRFVIERAYCKKQKSRPWRNWPYRRQSAQRPDPDWGGSLFWNLAARREQ